MSFLESQFEDDALVSREERAFRLWINSLGISTYINNVFEDLRNGYVNFALLYAEAGTGHGFVWGWYKTRFAAT